MIKGEGDDMGKVEDMGVIGQKKEETQKENPQKITQNKMSKGKKGPREDHPIVCPQMKE